MRQEENQLANGFAQIIVWQDNEDGVMEDTLVLRNYHGGQVGISNGASEIVIQKEAARKIAKAIVKLSEKEVKTK